MLVGCIGSWELVEVGVGSWELTPRQLAARLALLTLLALTSCGDLRVKVDVFDTVGKRGRRGPWRLVGARRIAEERQ